MKDEEIVCFELINSAAKTLDCYNQAIQSAKNYEFDKALEFVKKGEKIFVEGQKEHLNLIKKEANGESDKITLLLVHAEDQMMITELTKQRAYDMIDCYKKIKQLEDLQNK